MVQVEPGFRVLHVDAGPRAPVPKHELPALVDPFIDASMQRMLEREPVDVLHGNYWLSGAVAHRLKHELDLPLVATFHTLARVKAEAGVDDDTEHRTRVEHEVVACADLMLASTDDERAQLASLYDAEPDRIEVVPPGVDHTVFFPGDRAAARRRLGIDAPRVLLFVGRIQPLKGADLAIRALAALDDPKVALVIVGGPSGRDGHAEQARVHALAARARRRRADPLGAARGATSASPTTTAPPTCASCRRARSRSGSSRWRPPRAERRSSPPPSAGCARSSQHEHSGFLVEGRDPADFAAPVERLLADEILADEMGVNAAAAFEALLVEHDRRAPAPSLRRSRRPRARALRLTATRRR